MNLMKTIHKNGGGDLEWVVIILGMWTDNW